MITDSGVLYIEPGKASAEPAIDELTRIMAAAFRQAKPSPIAYRGWHTCNCGQHSSNRDYILSSGEQTNSLCVHYLAWHRNEVPQLQLENVRALGCEPVEPTAEELKAPGSVW